MDSLKVLRKNKCLYITLNRPDSLNAFDDGMVKQIGCLFESILNDEEISAVVITGAGRAFCAGADLKFQANLMERGEIAAEAEFSRSVQRMMKKIRDTKVPTIAAVNGIAVAGGLEIVLSCDLVMAKRSARLGDGHIKSGMLPGGGSSAILPKKIPKNIAKMVLFTGELYDASDWVRWGLINWMVDDDELSVKVDEVVNQLNAKSRIGLRYLKELIASNDEDELILPLERETDYGVRYTKGEDIKEGLAAFKNHRKPKFTEN